MSARSYSSTAEAVVGRRVYRGEIFYSARVRVQRRTVFRVEEHPSAQQVCLHVLEWSERQGKTLAWQYRNLNL